MQHEGPILVFWDTRWLFADRLAQRRAAVSSAAAITTSSDGASPHSLTVHEVDLAAGTGKLSALSLTPPLSLLDDLLTITGVQPPRDPRLAGLARNAGIRQLSTLEWPRPARVGLATLLVAEANTEARWCPPRGLGSAALVEQLTIALTGEELEAEPASPPLAAPARSMIAY